MEITFYIQDGRDSKKGIDAAKREAKEEVGITEYELLANFKETVRYFTRRDGKPIPKFVAMFLARAKTDAIILSWEHDTYEWLPYREAKKRLTLPQMRQTLETAHSFLQNQ